MSENNVTELKKGFRTPPQPSKGDVLKENQKLSEKVMTMLNFLNQQLLNLMQRTQQHAMELGAMSELLGYELSSEPLKAGDKALMGFMGQLVNENGSLGDIFDGGFSRLTVVGIGSGQFLPEFEKGLFGLKAGDKTVLKFKFPENYPAHLKGKEVMFKVNVYKTYKPCDGLYDLENDYAKLVEAKIAKQREEKAKEAPASEEAVAPVSEAAPEAAPEQSEAPKS